MSTIDHLLAHKGRLVHTIQADDLVYTAIGRMADRGVGALVVTEPDDDATHGAIRIVGMITERDYLRKVALQGRSSKQTFVRDIMSTPVFAVTPEHSVAACLALMNEHRIRHVPVVRDGDLVGIVSMGDIVRGIVEEQRWEISTLVDYIRDAAAPPLHGYVEPPPTSS